MVTPDGVTRITQARQGESSKQYIVYTTAKIFLFFKCFLANPQFIFLIFPSVAPHRGQPAAKYHPRWQPNLPEGWQSAVGWGDARFKLGTAGQQSGALPLSHHASMPANIASDIKANA
jgi:hypothetical protein